jgi:hypothetical protein
VEVARFGCDCADVLPRAGSFIQSLLIRSSTMVPSSRETPYSHASRPRSGDRPGRQCRQSAAARMRMLRGPAAALSPEQNCRSDRSRSSFGSSTWRLENVSEGVDESRLYGMLLDSMSFERAAQ